VREPSRSPTARWNAQQGGLGYARIEADVWRDLFRRMTLSSGLRLGLTWGSRPPIPAGGLKSPALPLHLP
jgi:hypothetical protein